MTRQKDWKAPKANFRSAFIWSYPESSWRLPTALSGARAWGDECRRSHGMSASGRAFDLGEVPLGQ